MTYNIVYANSVDTLAGAVQARLEKGWELQGAPFYDQEQARWCQAMVTHDSNGNRGDLKVREPKRR